MRYGDLQRGALVTILRFGGAQVAAVIRPATRKGTRGVLCRILSASGERWTATARFVPFEEVKGPALHSWLSARTLRALRRVGPPSWPVAAAPGAHKPGANHAGHVREGYLDLPGGICAACEREEKESGDPCGCADPLCPIHSGAGARSCSARATDTLFRIDQDDRTGTRFCPGCAADALQSGLFTDASGSAGKGGRS